MDEFTLSPELEGMVPEEIQEAMALQQQERMEQIQSIGKAIAKKRDDAVRRRAGSGIESEWLEAEEAYEGIDDANRNEHRTYKPLSTSGSAVIPRKGEIGRSTIYLNITRPYTDAASARLSDMLLPTDDKNWAIRPTPIPAVAGMQSLQPAPVPPTGAVPPGQPVAPEDEAKQKAEKAEKQIEDWLVECQWHAEMRKVLEDCARLGTGIMKGPFPTKRKMKRVQQTPNGMEMAIAEEIVPASRCVSPWNFYPDPNCGEDFRTGQYVFERDEVTTRQLKDLAGLPGYLPECIEKVLEEGPGKKSVHNQQTTSDDDTFELWYYTGILDKDDIEALGVETEDFDDDIPAIITLVNDTVIKAAINPLDSGEFPYDMLPWQRRHNSPWGMGVPMQIRSPQRMLNGASRNMMDNAGLSGGPQIILRRNAIEPADGSWALTPRKFWFAKEDADMRSVQDAIVAINIPNLQVELMNIVQFAMKQAEDVTGMPALMQGMQGKAPDTVGGMTMLNNNANSVLRRLARTVDDCVTEPHVSRYYEWILMYGPEDCQGDFQIDARGSAALVERDLQSQAILQMGAMVMNPAFGVSPERWFEEACKAQRIDPKKLKLTDEEKARMAQQPPPEAPQIAVAKIRAQTDMQRIQADMARAKMDQDRDLLYAQAQADNTRIEAMSRREELLLKREIAYLEAQVKKGIEVDANKVKLFETSAKLRTQKELSMMSMRADAFKHVTPKAATPPTEPAGKAPNGMGYQA